MQICIIGINFFPEKTGCAPYTTDLAKGLKELGHDIVVITGYPHYPEWKISNGYKRTFRKIENFENIEIFRFRHFIPKKMRIISRALYEISFAFHVIMRTKKFDSDVIIVISPSLLSMLIAIAKSRKFTKVKVLIQDMMSAALHQTKIKSNVGYNFIISALEKYLFLKMDSIAIVTEKFREVLNKYGIPDSMIVVSENYILPEMLQKKPRDIRNLLGWNANEIVVLYTGNFGSKLDLGNLIQAGKILTKTMPRVRIVLVGSGNQELELKKMAKSVNNVEFMDLFPEEDYLDLLFSANLLVVHESANNTHTSISSKVHSYRASGNPILVVCSESSPTFAQVIQHNLYHCNPANPALLAKKIQEICRRQNYSIEDFSKDYSVRNMRLEWVIDEK